MDKVDLTLNHLSDDEAQLVQSLRDHIGAPFLTAMTEDQQHKLKAFLNSLREPFQRTTTIH